MPATRPLPEAEDGQNTAKTWQVALTFLSVPQKARDGSAQLYMRLLVRYLRPQLGQALLLLFALCANILLQLINPLIMRRFLDSALAGGSLDFLTRLELLFIGIAAVQQVAAVSSTVLA